MATRAVVFDLWGTLVAIPRAHQSARADRWSARVAARMGVAPERVDELWYDPAAYEKRESGPLRPVLEELAAALGGGADADELLAERVELVREVLVPAAGTIETLEELRRRGLRTGLISNATEDVAIVWPDTVFTPHFDVALFSATAGLLKPDRRIYELACAELGVQPRDCLFVGDGANDELRGAQDVGMTPVLIHPDGEEPPWDDLRDWEGLRVTSIPQVLDLVR
jgi:putative hydrolase of the HAD superfamily